MPTQTAPTQQAISTKASKSFESPNSTPRYIKGKMQSKPSYSWAVRHTVYIVGFWTYSCKIHNSFLLSYFSPFENRSILSACPILVSQKQKTNFHNFIAGQLASRWTVSWGSPMSQLDNKEMTLQTSEHVQTPGATGRAQRCSPHIQDKHDF